DHLTAESANCLLKTLEEPPPDSLLILIGTNPHRQLPTIRSRCQLTRFRPLAGEHVLTLLRRDGLVSDPELAERLIRVCGGSLTRARQLSDPANLDFRTAWWQCLCTPDPDPVDRSKRLSQFVDAGGKEAPARRERLSMAIDFAIEFLRGAIRRSCGMPLGDSELEAALQAHPVACDAEALAAGIVRCIAAQQQLESNANLATLLETWLDELGRILRHGAYHPTALEYAL
ncbi:MAG TPA: hypothetical protein VIY86_08730, partial [Pirellulaceae bacterium]